jgi:hypothetical protein
MYRLLIVVALLGLCGCEAGLSRENTWEPDSSYKGSRWLYKERRTERRRG